MSRNSRFSKATKLKVIHEYREGHKEPLQIFEEFNINKSTVYRWNNLYEIYGSAAFDTKPRNRAYSKTDKISAVKEFMDGEYTVSLIMKKYIITSSSVLEIWIKNIMAMRNSMIMIRKVRYTWPKIAKQRMKSA